MENDFDYKKDFDGTWITSGADARMVIYADNVGKLLKKLSRSQFRNIYGEIKRIEMKGFKNELTAFHMLKPKVAYAYARDKKIAIFKYIFDKAYGKVSDDKTYRNFCNLMEAILAYHRLYSKQ